MLREELKINAAAIAGTNARQPGYVCEPLIRNAEPINNATPMIERIVWVIIPILNDGPIAKRLPNISSHNRVGRK